MTHLGISDALKYVPAIWSCHGTFNVGQQHCLQVCSSSLSLLSLVGASMTMCHDCISPQMYVTADLVEEKKHLESVQTACHRILQS